MRFKRSGALSYLRSEPLESRRLFAAPSAAVPFGLTDATFGTSGHSYASAQNGLDIIGSDQTFVSSSGKIYVEAGQYGQFIARFTAAGKLDTAFGTRGQLQLSGLGVAETVDSSDRLYVLLTIYGEPYTFTLTRYTAAGQPDSSFGTAGSVAVSTELFKATSLAVQPDGKPIVAGTESTDSGTGQQARLLRFNADGSIDTAFGSGGSVQQPLGSASTLTPTIMDQVNGVSVLRNGEIEVGGGTVSFSQNGQNQVFGNSYFAVERLTASGSLDTGYGLNGTARSVYQKQSAVNGSTGSDGTFLPASFSALPDGSAVEAGNNCSDTSENLDVARFSSAGGTVYNRLVPTDPLSDTLYSKVQVVALADGRAVLLGSAESTTTGYALTEIAVDGTAGPTVLTDDLNAATTDIDGQDSGSLAISASGQILVAGANTGRTRLVVQQLNAGVVGMPRPGDFANGGANSIALADDGFVYVSYYNTASRDLMFVRRLRNGLWDSPITLDPRIGAGQSVAVQVDQKNQPVVVYYDTKSRTLKSATSSDFGKTFTLASVDASPGVGQHVVGTANFDAFAAGQATTVDSFAYYDATHGDLKLASRDAAGKWSILTVDGSRDDVGRDIAITSTDEANGVKIAYYDATAGEVKYAFQTSQGYRLQNVTPAPGGVESLTILSKDVLDNFSFGIQDVPAIAFHDLGSGEVRLSTYRTGPKFTTHTIATQGGQSLALVESLAYSDPDVLSYNRSANRLSQIEDPFGGRAVSTVGSGGAALSLTLFLFDARLLSFIDPSDGMLKIRAF